MGNGSFTPPMIFSTGISRPIGIYLSDLNNVERVDIITVNYGDESVSIFYGNGNGHFLIR